MPVMNPYDKVLEGKGLKYSDLTDEEKEIYRKASSGVQAITVEDLHQYFAENLYALTLELCDTPDTPEFQDQNNKLKARVKNYAVLSAFLDTPYKVAKALQKEIENMA